MCFMLKCAERNNPKNMWQEYKEKAQWFKGNTVFPTSTNDSRILIHPQTNSPWREVWNPLVVNTETRSESRSVSRDRLNKWKRNEIENEKLRRGRVLWLAAGSSCQWCLGAAGRGGAHTRRGGERRRRARPELPFIHADSSSSERTCRGSETENTRIPTVLHSQLNNAALSGRTHSFILM